MSVRKVLTLFLTSPVTWPKAVRYRAFPWIWSFPWLWRTWVGSSAQCSLSLAKIWLCSLALWSTMPGLSQAADPPRESVTLPASVEDATAQDATARDANAQPPSRQAEAPLVAEPPAEPPAPHNPPAPLAPPNPAQPLVLQPDDTICLIGGGLGEGLQHEATWEALLHARFPQLRLRVRNLCFPGDEVSMRLRAPHFPTTIAQLQECRATVVVIFCGGNEAFRGLAALPDFKQDLQQLVREIQTTKFDDQAAPRVVLVSPIAAEIRASRTPQSHTALQSQLELYTRAISEVAAEQRITFANLFEPTQIAFGSEAPSDQSFWTSNGIQLTPEGQRRLAPWLLQAICGASDVPSASDASVESAHLLLAAIAQKDFYSAQRYRTINSLYLYGNYGELSFLPDKELTNREVLEREQLIWEHLIGLQDREIWRIVQQRSEQEPVAAPPPPLPVSSNFDGGQRRADGSIAYLSPAEALEKFQVAPDFAINCFASETDFPELVNPVQFVFDAQGRMWVACMPSYPQTRPGTAPRDKILILSDLDHDGRADKCTVFASGLHLPAGLELGPQGCYVAQAPDLLLLQDTNGDDQADTAQRILRGFGTADSHQTVNSLVWGPGGELYFQEGQAQYSQVETAHGVVRAQQGAIYEFNPLTDLLQVHVAYRFTNPWGHAFDRWGQAFVADSSIGANYWSTPFSGWIAYPNQHRELPQILTKRFRPTAACEIVSSQNFPAAMQGNYLLTNCIGDQGVFQYELRDESSGYAATEVTPLLRSRDRNFRPIDLGFGPDGALYIADWHHAIIGHIQHSLRDPARDAHHGRIYRVQHTQHPLTPVNSLKSTSLADLLDLLKSPQAELRYRVRRELRSRDQQEVRSQVLAWLSQLSATNSGDATDSGGVTDSSGATDSNSASDPEREHHRLEGLWVLQQIHHIDEPLLKELLRSSDFRVRAAATRVLCSWRREIPTALALLQTQATDSHPRVRVEAIRACSFFTGSDSQQAAECALAALAHPSDPYIEYTLQETLDALKPFLTAE